MQSLLQILVVNPVKSLPGRDGKPPFEIQDAECLLLNEDGSPGKVGVLRVPRDLRATIKAGVFMGSFGLDADYKNRQIGAVLVSLQEVRREGRGFVSADLPPAKKSA